MKDKMKLSGKVAFWVVLQLAAIFLAILVGWLLASRPDHARFDELESQVAALKKQIAFGTRFDLWELQRVLSTMQKDRNVVLAAQYLNNSIDTRILQGMHEGSVDKWDVVLGRIANYRNEFPVLYANEPEMQKLITRILGDAITNTVLRQ